jgi:hypothetical protein
MAAISGEAVSRVMADMGMLGEFEKLPPAEQRTTATSVLKAMRTADALGAIQDSGVGPPTPPVADRLWTILVVTLASVILIAVAGLVVTLFVKAQGSTTGEIILTIFTTTTAGLIGLFAPSPAQSSNKSAQ